MARTAPFQSVALDIVDWMFFNQLLVPGIPSDRERQWLQDLVGELRKAVRETGAIGAEAERLKHAALCLLEIRLGEAREKANYTASMALPDGLTHKMLLDAAHHASNVFQGMVLALCGKTDGIDAATVIGISDRLLGKFGRSSALVGHRLTERALLMEYPCAARDFFLCMAGIGIISSKKCDPEKGLSGTNVMSVARIAMLCELETIRHWMMGSTSLKVSDEVLMRESEELPGKAVEALLDRLSFYRRLTHGKDTGLLALLPGTLESREKAAAFLLGFGRRWKRSRMIDRTLGGWIGMLGAGMVRARKRDMPEKPIYVESHNAGSITDLISKELRTLGCTVSARTVYEGHQYLAANIQPKLEHYWHTQRAARGLPSAYPDLSYDIAVVGAAS